MKKFLPILLFFFIFNIYSQKEANFWYFGNKAALNFNSENPIPVSGSKLNTIEGCSSFSDGNGNLLFYVGASTPLANNLTIWDKNNNPMLNGVGLKGDTSSSQSALTIPAPNKPGIYYLFTVGAQSSTNSGFWYYTIDMNANGGLGAVIGSFTVLGNISNHPIWSEKVTAVRSKNCNEFWVISSAQGTFYAYRVNSSGVIVNTPTISTPEGYDPKDARGYLKISPNGKKIVAANMSDGTFLFNFNDETGEITNFENTNSPGMINLSSIDIGGDLEGYGVEFSLSSNVLYISTGESMNSIENLFQFDLLKTTLSEINESRFTVYSYRNSRGALQIAPNGKIYWTSNRSRFISVINNPENLGPDSNYSHLTVDVGATATANEGLPPFLSSLLLPIGIRDADTNRLINNQNLSFCSGESKRIIPELVTGNNISYEWSFDNGSRIEVIPTSAPHELTLNNLKEENSGKYTLTTILSDDCGNSVKLEGVFRIKVFESAIATKPKDIFFCDTDRDGFHSFDLEKDKTPEILNGLSNQKFDVFYFDSPDKATENRDPLPNVYRNPTSFLSLTIYVRVHNKEAIEDCFDITDFTLTVADLPIPVDPIPYRICDDSNSGISSDGIANTFLLNTKDEEICGSLDKALYKVTYHTTQNGAEINDPSTIIPKDINQTITNSKIVFIRLENIENPNCYNANKTLELIVQPLPKVIPVVNILECAKDPSEITTVNLTEAEINITDEINSTFVYFETEADAIAGTPEIADKLRYPVNQSAQAWVKTISEYGCVKISRIDIRVSYANSIIYNKTFEECDDFLDAEGNDTSNNSETDGITYFDFSIAEEELKNTFPDPENIEIFFYENSDDRDADINAIPDISKYRNNKNSSYAFNQTIFIKMKNKISNNCEGIRQLFLKTSTIPEFSVEGEAPNNPIIICNTNIPYTLRVLQPKETYDYKWTHKNGNPFGGNNSSVKISDGGEYTVTAFSRNSTICPKSRTIRVLKSDFGVLIDDFITITDDNTTSESINSNIQIDIPTNPLINEKFRYALENENGDRIRSFQNSNIFRNVKSGLYKILVENLNGCGISELVISVIQFPKFFSPNEDGVNDYWKIRGANSKFFPINSIHIFNRYGKLLSEIDIDSRGWDGFYQGKLLPSGDYWYNVMLIPNDNTKPVINQKGNFSLLRK